MTGMIIADTCIIFHLFNMTTLTERVREVLDADSHWIFPPLWREEYANILSKLARKEARLKEEVIQLFDYTVEELRFGEMIVETKRALEISMEY